MKIYRIADIKEVTDEVKQMEEMKRDVSPQELDEFKKQIDEQMKALTPKQKNDVNSLMDSHQKNNQVPGTPDNTTMPTTKDLQQKPHDKYEPPANSLSKDQKAIFSPVENIFKSKFDRMKSDIRDPKGKVIMYDLFDSLTDGNKADLTRNLNKMKPMINKFKDKEDAVEKRKQLEKNKVK